MIVTELDHLEKTRRFREQELQRKQLQFFLDLLNSYNTQATLVTGFAFTAFSADALHDLPYATSPIKSTFFASFSAIAMGTAVSVVCISSYLMQRVERLALTNSVGCALAAVRQRMPTIYTLYIISLIGLFGAASSLLFAMCDDDDDVCRDVGITVVGLFISCTVLALFVLNRIRTQFDRYGRGNHSCFNLAVDPSFEDTQRPRRAAPNLKTAGRAVEVARERAPSPASIMAVQSVAAARKGLSPVKRSETQPLPIRYVLRRVTSVSS